MQRPPYAILLASPNSRSLQKNLRSLREETMSILLVDDGSKTDLAKEASRAGLNAIRHPISFGRAQSLLSGVHYAVGDRSPGAILVANAEDPCIRFALPALARAIAYEPNAVWVAQKPSVFPDALWAARGLWKWFTKEKGPPYAASMAVFRQLVLGVSNRGPEFSFLRQVGEGKLLLRSCYL